MRLLSLLLLIQVLSASEAIADARPALVKIYAVTVRPDFTQPWAMQRPQQGTGSGAWIGNGRILTNAHVVAHATYIQIRRHGQPDRHRARVIAIDHGADIALLEPFDADLFAGVEPLVLGELPDTQAEVTVLGFPTGGDTLSVTRGVLSRVEHRWYAHSGLWLLAAQIDAAINPGNSGGPVLHDGRVVGIVMQGMTSSDNIGYMVPVPLLHRFFVDLADDGSIGGWPVLDVRVQNLESPDLRRWLDLPAGETGQRIRRVHPNSAAAGILQPDDVILSVDGLDVSDDGTVELRTDERTSMVWAIQRNLIGTTIPIDIWRDGGRRTVAIPLSRRVEDNQLVSIEQHDVRPRWFVFGGLVFAPLTRNYLAAWGRDWVQRAPRRLVRFIDDQGEEDSPEEVVILMRVLPHEANRGWHGWGNQVVESVDGEPVRSLTHLVELVEQGSGAFVLFGTPGEAVIVLDRASAQAAAAEIQATYRLPGDRSEDLVGSP